MNKEDIEQWKINPVTKIFFDTLKTEKNGYVEELTTHLMHDQSNVLLQMGKLIGKINVLDELIEGDLVSFLLNESKK